MSTKKTKKVKYSGTPSTFNFLEEDKSVHLLGWPGNRTWGDKSGLGYFETQNEMAHMKGLFIRWLFTGKFRTRNPFFLIIMFFLGLVCGLFPLAAILIEIIVSKNYSILSLLLWCLPYIAIGLALLVNVFLSIFDKNGKSITGD